MHQDRIICITERIVIGFFDENHITSEYLKWINDKDMMIFSEQRHQNHNVESCISYLTSFKESDNYFIAIENHHGQLYGTMTVYRDVNNNIADLGIMIGAEEARGEKIAQEAWTEVLKWVEQKFFPRKITAGCMSVNKAMLRIMEKSGMEPDGIRKNHYSWEGQNVDVVYMAKFYSE